MKQLFMGHRQSEENQQGGIEDPGTRNFRKPLLTLRTEGAGRGNGFPEGFEDWICGQGPLAEAVIVKSPRL